MLRDERTLCNMRECSTVVAVLRDSYAEHILLYLKFGYNSISNNNNNSDHQIEDQNGLQARDGQTASKVSRAADSEQVIGVIRDVLCVLVNVCKT